MCDEISTRCTIRKALESSEGLEGRFGQFEEMSEFESTGDLNRGEEKTRSNFKQRSSADLVSSRERDWRI